MLYEYCCLASLRGPLACGLALARPVSYSTCCGACITLHSRLPLPRAPTFDIFIHAPRPISGNRVLRLSGGHRPMQGQHSRRLPLHRGLLHRFRRPSARPRRVEHVGDFVKQHLRLDASALRLNGGYGHGYGSSTHMVMRMASDAQHGRRPAAR